MSTLIKQLFRVSFYSTTPKSPIHREEKVIVFFGFDYTNIMAPATANAAKVVSMVIALLKRL